MHLRGNDLAHRLREFWLALAARRENWTRWRKNCFANSAKISGEFTVRHGVRKGDGQIIPAEMHP